MSRTTFYFDLGSPYAYLASERLRDVLPGPVEWQPVSLGALFKLAGRGSWSLAGPGERAAGIAEVERRAAAYGLPPVRWPEPWPGNYLMAMRAATFADRCGRGREFARCAFRAGFQGGEDLSHPAAVLRAADAAGLDPLEVQRAVEDPEVKLALREGTDKAYALGVFGVPTVLVEGELFWGDDQLAAAAGSLSAGGPRR
jgi:2-hydroxychromene-2-carboxylate isomerase